MKSEQIEALISQWSREFGVHLTAVQHMGLQLAFRNTAILQAATRDAVDDQSFIGKWRTTIKAMPDTYERAASRDALSDPAVEAFLSEVRAELMRARTKFPGDRIMGLALAEEFGELCKAMLDESAENVRKEAVQTAVMCARVVLDGDGSVIEWRKERGLDPLIAASAPKGDGNDSD